MSWPRTLRTNDRRDASWPTEMPDGVLDKTIKGLPRSDAPEQAPSTPLGRLRIRRLWAAVNDHFGRHAYARNILATPTAPELAHVSD